jgi:hypothetical protein
VVGKYSFKYQKLLDLTPKLSLENNKKGLNLFYYLAFQNAISSIIKHSNFLLKKTKLKSKYAQKAFNEVVFLGLQRIFS